jgi:hypothetical protein
MLDNIFTGTSKKKKQKLVLDPADPVASARMLVRTEFTSDDDLRTLWRHRGCFWLWSGSYYQRANDETIDTRVRTFLEKAKREKLNKSTGKWETDDFKPKRTHVGEVAAALATVCQLDEHIDPPAWLFTRCSTGHRVPGLRQRTAASAERRALSGDARLFRSQCIAGDL